MESNIGKNIGIKNGIKYWNKYWNKKWNQILEQKWNSENGIKYWNKYWNKNGILKMESIPRINIGIQCLETNLYSYTEKTILYSFLKN